METVAIPYLGSVHTNFGAIGTPVLDLFHSEAILSVRKDPNVILRPMDNSLCDVHCHWRIYGGVPGARPPPLPQGSRSFRFDIQNFRNLTASGVGTPPYEVDAPLREILDPPLTVFVLFYGLTVMRLQIIKMRCICIT